MFYLIVLFFKWKDWYNIQEVAPNKIGCNWFKFLVVSFSDIVVSAGSMTYDPNQSGSEWVHKAFLKGFKYTLFFISNTFISNARLKLEKNEANTKQHFEAEHSLFENYSLSSSTWPSKNSKKCRKNKYICFHDVIWLMTMKMKLKMKNRSQSCDLNWSRTRPGQRYTKYKMLLSIMIVICIKKHPSNIWSSVHENVKQHWDWVKKRVAYKKACTFSVYKGSSI